MVSQWFHPSTSLWPGMTFKVDHRFVAHLRCWPQGTTGTQVLTTATQRRFNASSDTSWPPPEAKGSEMKWQIKTPGGAHFVLRVVNPMSDSVLASWPSTSQKVVQEFSPKRTATFATLGVPGVALVRTQSFTQQWTMTSNGCCSCGWWICINSHNFWSANWWLNVPSNRRIVANRGLQNREFPSHHGCCNSTMFQLLGWFWLPPWLRKPHWYSSFPIFRLWWIGLIWSHRTWVINHLLPLVGSSVLRRTVENDPTLEFHHQSEGVIQQYWLGWNIDVYYDDVLVGKSRLYNLSCNHQKLIAWRKKWGTRKLWDY